MVNSQKIALKILIGIILSTILFHILLFLKFIPFEFAWGGKVESKNEMYVLESVAVLLNLFFLYLLLQKGNFMTPVFSKKVLSVLLWIFLGIFGLNTLGNLFAETKLEKLFAMVTLLISILTWWINKNFPKK